MLVNVPEVLGWREQMPGRCFDKPFTYVDSDA